MDGCYVWVRLPERFPGEAIVWHLATWAAPGYGVRRPACGASAPAWTPWLSGDDPGRFVGDGDALVELCRPCLHALTVQERRDGRQRQHQQQQSEQQNQATGSDEGRYYLGI